MVLDAVGKVVEVRARRIRLLLRLKGVPQVINPRRRRAPRLPMPRKDVAGVVLRDRL